MPPVQALEHHDWSVWWDRTILPGTNYDEVIEAALSDARCVSVLWSRESVRSDWVRTEAEDARERRILLPALLDDVRIPLAFRRLQAARLTEWTGSKNDLNFEQLCRAVSHILGQTGTAVAKVAPAVSTIASEQQVVKPDECPAPEPEQRKGVFVSYAWTDPSNTIVDQIEKLCKDRSITVHRDKSEMLYGDSIRDFMQRIGRGKCIVVVLSKAYLESKSCMFELTESAAREDIRGRVFPVVLEDANIYDAKGRLGYIRHWERQKAELDSAMKEVGGEHLEGIREEIDLFAKIRTTIARIVDILSDMNALTPDQHRGSNFQALLSALEARLSE